MLKFYQVIPQQYLFAETDFLVTSSHGAFGSLIQRVWFNLAE